MNLRERGVGVEVRKINRTERRGRVKGTTFLVFSVVAQIQESEGTKEECASFRFQPGQIGKGVCESSSRQKPRENAFFILAGTLKKISVH